MAVRERAELACQRPQARVPRERVVRQLQLPEQSLDEPVEEVVLVCHVTVESHRRDAQLASDEPHRQPLESIALGHGERPSSTRSLPSGGLCTVYAYRDGTEKALDVYAVRTQYGRKGPSDMRVAIVSDIHGNLTAFEAVLADIESKAPDLVLQGGDLVLMGAQPARSSTGYANWAGPESWATPMRPCGAPGAATPRRTRPQARATSELDLSAIRTRDAGDARRGASRLAARTPNEYRLEHLVLVHASPGDLWRAPAPDADDDELSAAYGSLGAATSVYGHIHRPYTRT